MGWDLLEAEEREKNETRDYMRRAGRMTGFPNVDSFNKTRQEAFPKEMRRSARNIQHTHTLGKGKVRLCVPKVIIKASYL